MRKPAMRKRCAKCGQISIVKPRERRCKQVVRKGFGREFYCWGNLTALQAPIDAMNEIATTDAAAKRAPQRPQVKAERQLQATRTKIDEHYDLLGQFANRQARCLRRLRKLEAAARRYAQRASMTDAELQAEKDQREARAKAKVKKTRAIEV